MCGPGPACIPSSRTTRHAGRTDLAPSCAAHWYVEVTRLPGRSHQHNAAICLKVLWLWWQGAGKPDLDLLWRSYVRRFDLEHTFRFLKQVLGWTTTRVRHPQQADSMDLAGSGGLHSAQAGPQRGGGSPTALGTAARGSTPNPVPGAEGVFSAPGCAGQSGERAETLWPVAGAAQRQPLRTCPSLSGPQEGLLNPPPRPMAPS